MSGLKLLIDTNILIGLEDHRQIDASFSALQQKCHANGVQLWIHEASRTDIERDKDDPRKAIILSKIAKFNELTGIPLPSEADLVATYGRIKSQNDLVDVTLLHALHGVGAVDFLITQDRGIRKRAQTIGALNRVFTVEDALIWLRDTFERVAVNLPYIEEKQCHQIDRRDDIFQSLQDDYSGFEQWFSDNCVRNHRPCWVVTLDDELAGIAIHKDESFEDLTRDIPLAENNFVSPPTKILKICTFKIKEKYRGEKFGEQLLKQILWWCNKNGYDFVYLTIYPKHKALVDLLLQYGFEGIGRKSGELYFGKAFRSGVLNVPAADTALAYHHQYYPSFLSDGEVSKYLVPIHGDYYETLFPENINRRQADLFGAAGSDSQSKIPGNTIRKVYVCRTPTKSIVAGDILLFFHLKDERSHHSQSLITVGIVDGFDVTSQTDELLRLTAKRSVFRPDELEEFTVNGTKDVKVINFLLAGHISPVILYAYLEEIGVTGPYQSIRRIKHEHFALIKPHLRLNVA